MSRSSRSDRCRFRILLKLTDDMSRSVDHRMDAAIAAQMLGLGPRAEISPVLHERVHAERLRDRLMLAGVSTHDVSRSSGIDHACIRHQLSGREMLQPETVSAINDICRERLQRRCRGRP